jgi:hypothetical protein
VSSTPPVWLTTPGCAKNQVAPSHREAPAIDGVLLLDGGEPGQWLPARVTAAYGSELSAEVVG